MAHHRKRRDRGRCLIPIPYIGEWRHKAPWSSDAQVEQDLILSRAIVELFSDPELSKRIVFRGGTALHKLFFPHPLRYSEDIDLVHIKGGPVGSLFDRIREKLDPWLGKPKRERSQGGVQLFYRFQTESAPIHSRRLKVEINTQETFNVLPIEMKPFDVATRWFTGRADIVVYALEELMGTKLRALYQRRKGRDLFDLAMLLDYFPRLDRKSVIQCFQTYMDNSGHRVTRAQFEQNLTLKLRHKTFLADIGPLLASSGERFEVSLGAKIVRKALIEKLPGEAWKGTPRE